MHTSGGIASCIVSVSSLIQALSSIVLYFMVQLVFFVYAYCFEIVLTSLICYKILVYHTIEPICSHIRLNICFCAVFKLFLRPVEFDQVGKSLCHA